MALGPDATGLDIAAAVQQFLIDSASGYGEFLLDDDGNWKLTVDNNGMLVAKLVGEERCVKIVVVVEDDTY